MTIPGWGRLTPVQINMLMLAGRLGRHPREPGMELADKERMEAMAVGRKWLPRLTGVDFGYDLQRWHEHLLGADEHGYRHPYGWRVVRQAIEKALEDLERLQLVRQLEQSGAKLSSRELAVLIVDALIDVGLVKKDSLAPAIDIAAEEIEVRKALGDY
jgi:peptidoglycan/xylan/chitin deacetylase (PgdA/CDA1 family)